MLDGLGTPATPLREIAVSDMETVEALFVGVPRTTPTPGLAPLGSYMSVPIVLDGTLMPGTVQLRDADGTVREEWTRIVGGRWLKNGGGDRA
jgi:hypothetical protein